MLKIPITMRYYSNWKTRHNITLPLKLVARISKLFVALLIMLKRPHNYFDPNKIISKSVFIQIF